MLWVHSYHLKSNLPSKPVDWSLKSVYRKALRLMRQTRSKTCRAILLVSGLRFPGSLTHSSGLSFADGWGYTSTRNPSPVGLPASLGVSITPADQRALLAQGSFICRETIPRFLLED